MFLSIGFVFIWSHLLRPSWPFAHRFIIPQGTRHVGLSRSHERIIMMCITYASWLLHATVIASFLLYLLSVLMRSSAVGPNFVRPSYPNPMAITIQSCTRRTQGSAFTCNDKHVRLGVTLDASPVRPVLQSAYDIVRSRSWLIMYPVSPYNAVAVALLRCVKHCIRRAHHLLLYLALRRQAMECYSPFSFFAYSYLFFYSPLYATVPFAIRTHNPGLTR
jgi:hypothetical protein